MTAITLPAHFDGSRILLDEPFELEPDTKLMITVLPKQQEDDERQDWRFLSQQALLGLMATRNLNIPWPFSKR